MSRQVVAQARCLKAGILARFHDHWQLGQPAASHKLAAGFPPADTFSSHLFYRRVAFLACLASVRCSALGADARWGWLVWWNGADWKASIRRTDERGWSSAV